MTFWAYQQEQARRTLKGVRAYLPVAPDFKPDSEACYVGYVTSRYYSVLQLTDQQEQTLVEAAEAYARAYAEARQLKVAAIQVGNLSRLPIPEHLTLIEKAAYLHCDQEATLKGKVVVPRKLPPHVRLRTYNIPEIDQVSMRTPELGELWWTAQIFNSKIIGPALLSKQGRSPGVWLAWYLAYYPVTLEEAKQRLAGGQKAPSYEKPQPSLVLPNWFWEVPMISPNTLKG